MRLVESIFILLAVSVLGGSEVCEETSWHFTVCKESDTVTRVTDTNAFNTRHFKGDFQNDITIGACAFATMKLEILEMHFPVRSAEEKHLTHSLSLLPESFAGLPKLITLVVDYAKINFKGGNPLSTLESLTTLLLMRGNLSKVPTDLFEAVPKLEVVSLKGNDISAIHQDDFTPLKHLTGLDLSGNKITSMEAGSFGGVSTLERLDVSFNAFPAVRGLLRGIPLLKVLTMSGCFDQNGFQKHLLEDVPNIHTLKLGFNNLTALSAGMFDALTSLRMLSLKSNKIRDVPTGVFEHLTSLKDICLSNNEIGTIARGAFGNLNLEELALSLNELKTIRSDTFKGLTVRRLGLGINSISRVEPKAFNGLQVSRLLDLTENDLTVIGPEDFSGLTAKTLALGSNRIEVIAEDAFKDTVMERIGLQENPLDIAHKGTWGLAESVKVFK